MVSRKVFWLTSIVWLLQCGDGIKQLKESPELLSFELDRSVLASSISVNEAKIAWSISRAAEYKISSDSNCSNALKPSLQGDVASKTVVESTIAINDVAPGVNNLYLCATDLVNGDQVSRAFTISRTDAVLNQVSSPEADGSYGANAVINIDLVFGAAAVVNGAVSFALNSGGNAIYSSGSGTNTLRFQYTVEAGHSSADLELSNLTILTLLAGEIKDTNGGDAYLNMPAAGSSNRLAESSDIVIDTQGPLVTGAVAIPDDSTVRLRWNDPADDDLASVEVRRSTTGVASCSDTSVYTGSFAYFIDTTVTNGTTYYYAICATDSVTAGLANTSAVNLSATPSANYSISGNVFGLNGTIQLSNGGETISVTSDGRYTFPTMLADTTAYNVSISTQPSGQSCSLENATGNIDGFNIYNINVRCYTKQFVYASDSTGNLVYSYSVGAGGLLSLVGSKTINGARGLLVHPSNNYLFVATSGTYYSIPLMADGTFGTESSFAPGNSGDTTTLGLMWLGEFITYKCGSDAHCRIRISDGGKTLSDYAAKNFPFWTIKPTVHPNGFLQYNFNKSSAAFRALTIDAAGVFQNQANIGTNDYPEGAGNGVVDKKSGRFIYIANSDIDNGGARGVSYYSLGSNGTTLAHVNRIAVGTTVQGANMTHAGDFLYVCIDSSIYGYSINQSTGALTAVPSASFSAGTLPRRITISLDDQYLYAIDQTGGSIYQFQINADGSLTPLSTPSISTGTTNLFDIAIVARP